MTKRPGNGKQLAEENIDALVALLARYRESGTPLPRYNGELNRTKVAAECGFERQVFRTNARCAALITAADEEDREQHLNRLEQAELKREEKGKIDQDRAELEAENLRLMAENASLKLELERFRRLEVLMAETGKLSS